MDFRPISADSHITEPPNCYLDYIDPKFRDVAPHIVYKEGVGDIYVINGMNDPIPMGLVAAAGMAPIEIRITKNSPTITVNFTADAELPPSYDVKVGYRLDGGEEKFVTRGATSSQQYVSFKAIVPNDADHTITLTKVTTDNFADDRSGDIGTPRGGVHRNQEYTFGVKLKAISPK